MKLNRITSLAAVVVAVLIVVGQFVAGAKAAPPAQPAAHFQASGITAQVSQPAQAAAKTKAARPADQSPLDFTVQGRLTDHSGNPITSPTAVVFNLYSAPSGGTAELTQSATVTPDSNGLFTYVFVVDTTSNFNNVQLFDSKQYLGIKVGSDAEMTPRFELTASPYAMSLAPGAQITGNFDYSANHDNGLLNLYNTNTTSSSSAGLFSSGSIGVWGASNDTSTSTKTGVYGTGATGVWGDASSTGTSNGYGGFFHNAGGGSGSQYGVYATSPGWGIYSGSSANNAGEDSAGVVGISTVTGDSTHLVAGGVFTDTNAYGLGVVGYGGSTDGNSLTGIGVLGIDDNNNASGVYAQAAGVNGVGAEGSARNYPNNGDPSAFGGDFVSYDGGSTHLGLQVYGQGHATGGFSTGLGYYMTVKYNGSDTLHPGDILALDGNNVLIDGVKTLGAVKATASNAGAAIGVAQYRLRVYAASNKAGGGHIEQPDTTATSIKPGDLVQIVIVGQATIKVNGSVSIGDRLAIGSDGSISAAKADNANTIGKVAEKPDNNGNVTVFVNFK